MIKNHVAGIRPDSFNKAKRGSITIGDTTSIRGVKITESAMKPEMAGNIENISVWFIPGYTCLSARHGKNTNTSDMGRSARRGGRTGSVSKIGMAGVKNIPIQRDKFIEAGRSAFAFGCERIPQVGSAGRESLPELGQSRKISPDL